MTKQKKETAEKKQDHSLLTMGIIFVALGTVFMSTTDTIWIPLFFIATAIIMLVKYLTRK